MANATIQGTILSIKVQAERIKFTIEGFIEAEGEDMEFDVLVNKTKKNVELEEGESVRVVGFDPYQVGDFGRWVLRGL